MRACAVVDESLFPPQPYAADSDLFIHSTVSQTEISHQHCVCVCVCVYTGMLWLPRSVYPVLKSLIRDSSVNMDTPLPVASDCVCV